MLLSVNRQPDSNTVQVADEVHQEMAAHPADASRRASRCGRSTISPNIVNESIASVRDAIVIGLFLAGLIIWLFLRDWGTAVMTGLVVPVTMVVTFIAMKVLGQSFNLMTLGGLAAAVGLVIDDKIVVVENIVLHRDAGEGPLQATASALQGTDGAADRFDADADRRVPAADHDHRRHRNVLQRPGHRDERLAADLAGPGAGLDQQPRHATDSRRPSVVARASGRIADVARAVGDRQTRRRRKSTA